MSIKVGDLVAKVESPHLLYRIASIPMKGYFRAIPFQRQGSEVILSRVRSVLTDGSSRWKLIQ